MGYDEDVAKYRAENARIKRLKPGDRLKFTKAAIAHFGCEKRGVLVEHAVFDVVKPFRSPVVHVDGDHLPTEWALEWWEAE